MRERLLGFLFVAVAGGAAEQNTRVVTLCLRVFLKPEVERSERRFHVHVPPPSSLKLHKGPLLSPVFVL